MIKTFSLSSTPSHDRAVFPRPCLLLYLVVLFCLSLLLILLGQASSIWRIEHDSALIHYIAFLVNEHDYVPYRDIYDTCMPGSILFHCGIGLLVGYGDTAFRLVDLTLLGLVLISIWLFMRRFGHLTAWFAAVLCGLAYLQRGVVVSLERDYIGFMPVLFALPFVTSRRLHFPVLKCVITGFFFGLAALNKPHILLGLPIFLVFIIHDQSQNITTGTSRLIRRLTVAVLAIVFGLIVPILPVFLWLFFRGALSDFFEMIIRYLPLYNALTGLNATISGSERVSYLLTHFLDLGNLRIWLIPAIPACYYGLRLFSKSDRTRLALYLLIGLNLVYAVYPVFAGKFWGYHWIPFELCIIMLSTTVLGSAIQASVTWGHKIFLTSTLFLSIFMSLELPHILSEIIDYSQGKPASPPKRGHVDELASIFKKHLKPGEYVQPLDWGAGSVHAMLLAQIMPGSRYFHDYYFYHHVSQPIIQKMRQTFLDDLERIKPRLIVKMKLFRPIVSGHDTVTSFQQLDDYIRTRYHPYLCGQYYEIYERKRE